MNFYTWMMKKHINTKAPVGDLARDMKDDREFPHDGDKETIQGYLESCGACSGCMDAFERAWKKYEREAGVRAAKVRGGICPKFVSPGFDGMPDRIVLLPGRHFGFVEVKALGEVPRPLQVSRHRLMEKLGFRVYVLDDPEKIGGILDEIQAT